MNRPATEVRIKAMVAAVGGRRGDGWAHQLLAHLEGLTDGEVSSVVGSALGWESAATVEPIPEPEPCQDCGGSGEVTRESGDGSHYTQPCACPAGAAK